MLSLDTIAACLGGRVRGDRVSAPGSEAPTKKGARRRRRTLTVWIAPSGSDILVHSHAGVPWTEAKDFVRAQCGLKPWEPGSGNAASKPAPKKPLPPLAERDQFLAESLRIARHRGHVTFEQLSLIINDLKNACPADEVERRAIRYAREFGFTDSDAVEALRPAWRAYNADDRARVFAVSYGLHRLLDLRRTGCVDFGRAERRRLTHQRYNSKRRARRAQKPCGRLAKLTEDFLSSSAVTTIRETPSFRKKSPQEEGASKQIEIPEVEDQNPRATVASCRACVPEARKVDPGPARSGSRKIVVDRRVLATSAYLSGRSALSASEGIRENQMSKKSRKIEAMIALLCERGSRAVSRCMSTSASRCGWGIPQRHHRGARRGRRIDRRATGLRTVLSEAQVSELPALCPLLWPGCDILATSWQLSSKFRAENAAPA